MSILQAILLGALQGVAEFLPISSSGHLAIAQSLFNLEELPLLFDVFLHLATLAAVVLFFWKKIWELMKIFGRWISRKQIENKSANPDGKNFTSDVQSGAVSEIDIISGNDFYGRKTIVAIIVSSVITAAIGVLTSKLIPDMPVKVVCGGFFLTSAMLLNIRYFERKRSDKLDEEVRLANLNGENARAPEGWQTETAPKPISILQSIVIGFMQGLGTLPGISRSGSTIAGALFCGVDRKTAGEYSFIVSIPAILGAFILEAKDLGEVSSNIGAVPVIAGCVTAFAVGYFSLAFLMKVIQKGKLEWFAAYLIPAGILGMLFL